MEEPLLDIPTARPRMPPAPPVRVGVLLFHLLLTGIAAGGIVVEHGFYTPPLDPILIHAIQGLCLGLYIADTVWRRRTRRTALPDGGMTWIDLLLYCVALLGAVLHVTDVTNIGWHFFEVSAALLFLGELWRTNVGLLRLVARPGFLLPLSFLTLIAVGTVLLKAPVAVPPGETISWLDALFTMTSAVCVTGLVVRDTATAFTPFGQTVILLFIQLGGLGIIIFGSTLALLLGRGLSLREHVTLGEMLEAHPLRDITDYVRFIVLTTLAIEFIGACLLWPLWDPATFGETELTQARRWGLSLFHAISAFCNAGFDITGQSMVPYRFGMLTHAVVAPLIIIGGLGFPVLENFYGIARHRLRQMFAGRMRRFRTWREAQPFTLVGQRLSLHTRVVLVTSAMCYLFGVLFIGAGQLMPYVYEAFEEGQTAHVERPGPLTLAAAGRILADASFMSITARTAGFNALPMEELEPAGRFTVMVLMLIGGSPASTAGGAKTTTLALLVLSVVATMYNRRETEAFGRRIADALVRRAATIGICFILLVGVSTLLLTLSEPFPFERLFFEAISAAATVGLSLGVTPDLSAFGKGVIIVTMYLGRVGPLALLGALIFTRRTRRPYAYPHEEVVLG